MKNKESFEFNYVDDNGESQTLKLALVAPTRGMLQKARMEHNRTFAESLKNGAILRAKLNDFMEEQGLWNTIKEKEFQSLAKNIADADKIIHKGGIRLSEGKNICLEVRKNRVALQQLLSDRTNLDAYTAEGQAENMRFNSLLSQCLVYDDTGKPYFKSLDEYLEKSDERLAMVAAEKFASFHYGLSENFEDTLFENQFLKQWGFVDEKLRLINKDGKLVNEDGKLVDEFGRFVNEDGQLIDYEGNPIDNDGNYNFNTQPFLDDNDNPIVEETKKEE